MVGSFEAFLTDAFEEHLGLLATLPPPVPFSQLPEKLRLSSVFESLHHATAGPRYGQAGGRAARYADVMSAARRVAAETIDPQALGRTKGNPNSERVTEMFGSLGIRDIFSAIRPNFNSDWGKPEASSFLNDKLDEIVNARHVVAHTARSLSISRADLGEWPLFLKALAKALDRRLEAYRENVIARKNPP